MSGKDDFPKDKTVDPGLKGWIQLSGTIVELLDRVILLHLLPGNGQLGRCLLGIMSTHHPEEFSSSPEPQPTWAIRVLTALGLSSWSVRHQVTLETPFPESLLPGTANLTEPFLGAESATLGIIPWPDTGRSCGEAEMLGVEKAEGVN